MKSGGSKAKGSEFERFVCTKLSLWISEGARADLFTRNVLSGGRFTQEIAKKGQEPGTPGDLMAANPLAFHFLTHFVVECKHHKDIGIARYFMRPTSETFLGKVYQKTQTDAHLIKALPIIVAKQNHIEPIMIIPHDVLVLAIISCAGYFPLHYHTAHSNAFGVLSFNQFLTKVDASIFMAKVEETRKTAREMGKR